MNRVLNVAEATLKAFEWRLFTMTGVWEWFQKNGASVGATVSDDKTRLTISLSIPNDRMQGAILPLMSALTLLSEAARSDDNGAKVLPESLAAHYTAKHWFPPAAAEYLTRNMDRFEVEGGWHWDQERLFDLVMEKVFWANLDIDMKDPVRFDQDVREAIDPDTWERLREQFNDSTMVADNGVRQRDFLARKG